MRAKEGTWQTSLPPDRRGSSCSVFTADLDAHSTDIPVSPTQASIASSDSESESDNPVTGEVVINDGLLLFTQAQGLARPSIIEAVIAGWFERAACTLVVEASCAEMDSEPGVVHFSVKLDSDYRQQLKHLRLGESLRSLYWRRLLASLPNDLVQFGIPPGKTVFDTDMCEWLTVSMVKEGSVVVIGTVALGLVVFMILVMSLASSSCTNTWDTWGPCCLSRSKGGAGGSSPLYSGALREMALQGATFQVGQDGSVKIDLPPGGSNPCRPSSSGCALM